MPRQDKYLPGRHYFQKHNSNTEYKAEKESLVYSEGHA